jgi:hypothetical protein
MRRSRIDEGKRLLVQRRTTFFNVAAALLCLILILK